MELIYKFKLDSISLIREELKSEKECIQYYDSGTLFIIQRERGVLKFECDSVQGFAFQLADFLKVKEIGNDRFISDNEEYNLILCHSLDKEGMVSLTEEWNDYNSRIRLLVQMEELKQSCIDIFKEVNMELAFLIPEIITSNQFKEYESSLVDFLNEDI